VIVSSFIHFLVQDVIELLEPALVKGLNQSVQTSAWQNPCRDLPRPENDT
jgi:hypothetical protein